MQPQEQQIRSQRLARLLAMHGHRETLLKFYSGLLDIYPPIEFSPLTPLIPGTEDTNISEEQAEELITAELNRIGEHLATQKATGSTANIAVHIYAIKEPEKYFYVRCTYEHEGKNLTSFTLTIPLGEMKQEEQPEHLGRKLIYSTRLFLRTVVADIENLAVKSQSAIHDCLVLNMRNISISREAARLAADKKVKVLEPEDDRDRLIRQRAIHYVRSQFLATAAPDAVEVAKKFISGVSAVGSNNKPAVKIGKVLPPEPDKSQDLVTSSMPATIPEPVSTVPVDEKPAAVIQKVTVAVENNGVDTNKPTTPLADAKTKSRFLQAPAHTSVGEAEVDPLREGIMRLLLQGYNDAQIIAQVRFNLGLTSTPPEGKPATPLQALDDAYAIAVRMGLSREEITARIQNFLAAMEAPGNRGAGVNGKVSRVHTNGSAHGK